MSKHRLVIMTIDMYLLDATHVFQQTRSYGMWLEAPNNLASGSMCASAYGPTSACFWLTQAMVCGVCLLFYRCTRLASSGCRAAAAEEQGLKLDGHLTVLDYDRCGGMWVQWLMTCGC